MKNIHLEKVLKGRAFKRKPHLNIKRVRQEPRQKIRQLLRSFAPLTGPESEAQTGNGSQPYQGYVTGIFKVLTKVHRHFRGSFPAPEWVAARCIFVHKNDLAALMVGTSRRNLRSLEPF